MVASVNEREYTENRKLTLPSNSQIQPVKNWQYLLLFLLVAN